MDLIKTLAIWAVVVLVVLALVPVGITMAGQELTASLTAANSTLDSVQPTLTKFSFGIAALAIVFGGVLLAFGHGKGMPMVKGALMLALIGAGSGVLLNYLGAQGPTLATSLTNGAGGLFQQIVQRLP